MTFIPGLKLSERFYFEVVKPVLDHQWPDLAYSAGLMGDGSEILGFDTERSTDHDWGPRLYLFLSEDQFSKNAENIVQIMEEQLPDTFCGYPVTFHDRDRPKRLCAETAICGSSRHGVEIFTPRSFFRKHLGLDPYLPIQVWKWLAMPSQLLNTAVKGALFHDDLGIGEARKNLAFYPHDLWLYLMAAQWTKISQEEAFLGRSGELGDKVGGHVIMLRLIRELMLLCFLIEKQYAPYSKWLGTAFSKLRCASMLMPVLERAMMSSHPPDQEVHMIRAYQIVAEMHNDLKVTKALSTEASLYHDRPYRVLHTSRFAEALKVQIRDEAIQKLSLGIGSVNQFVDNTDVLCHPVLCEQIILAAHGQF